MVVSHNDRPDTNDSLLDSSHPWNLRNYIDVSDEDILILKIPTRDVVTLIFRTRSCLYPCVSEAGRFGHGFDKHGHVTPGHIGPSHFVRCFTTGRLTTGNVQDRNVKVRSNRICNV